MSETVIKNLSSSEFHSNNPFCQVGSNGKGYVMGSWMMPSFSSDPNAYCVLLWFKEWTLDTSGKYIFACIGLLLMGFCHWMLTIRQEIVSRYIKDIMESQVNNQKEETSRRNLILLRNFEVTLYYGLQMWLAYLLMLVVMTYDIVLIIVVIIGLMFGHFTKHYFLDTKSRRVVTGSPCCSCPGNEEKFLESSGRKI